MSPEHNRQVPCTPSFVADDCWLLLRVGMGGCPPVCLRNAMGMHSGVMGDGCEAEPRLPLGMALVPDPWHGYWHLGLASL